MQPSVKLQSGRKTMLLIGAGYTARHMVPSLIARGFEVIATSRKPEGLESLRALGATAMLFDGQITSEMIAVCERATHMISSVGPKSGADPILASGIAKHFQALRWGGYLSATSVYGDRQGKWAFEDEYLYPTTARGRARIEAELGWLETDLPMHIFRLAGIYGPAGASGPARNPFARLRAGTAKAVIKPGHVVNRIHVEDIISALYASMERPNPAQVYNIADGHPAPPQDVLRFAATLIGAPMPQEVDFSDAELSDMARSFYTETKRIDITRTRSELEWEPRYEDYKSGLKAIADK
ncbi:MAG: SDR family oxidoreductase [Maricaulaceae bacterium]